MLIDGPLDPDIQRRLDSLNEPQFAGDHAYVPTVTGLCNRCRRPLAEHPPKVGIPAIWERGLATGRCTGPETGPGRGVLSDKWFAWARVHPWASS